MRASVSCRGRSAALVGVNGSGQVHHLQGDHGLRAASAGEVRNPRPAGRRRPSRRTSSPTSRRAEEVDWNFPVLVEDVVMMGRYGHMNWLRMPSRADRDKVDEALERVGMTAFRNARSASSRAARRSASSSPARWRRKARSSCSTSPSPASTSTPKSAIVELLGELRDERPRHAGLHAQSRQRAGFLRPGGSSRALCSPPARRRRSSRKPEPRACLRRRAAPLHPRRPRSARRRGQTRSVKVTHRRRAPASCSTASKRHGETARAKDQT
jgi:hypothetical protein